MGQMKWTDGYDALVDFVEEHGGSMGGETRDYLFNIVQNIIDGQVVGCNLDGDGYCSTHTSWRCFPNLGEVAGVKTLAPSGPLSDPEGVFEAMGMDEPKFPEVGHD